MVNKQFATSPVRKKFMTAADYLREEGKEEGVRQGMQQGIQQGMQQGMQQGIQQGKYEEKKSLAKRLLQKGMNIEEVAALTDLPRNEVAAMQNTVMA